MNSSLYTEELNKYLVGSAFIDLVNTWCRYGLQPFELLLILSNFKMHLTLLCSLMALAMAQTVVGWGDVGHRTVGYQAQRYFTDEADQWAEGMLANDNGWDISDAAVFADTVKRKEDVLGGQTVLLVKTGQDTHLSAPISFASLKPTTGASSLNTELDTSGFETIRVSLGTAVQFLVDLQQRETEPLLKATEIADRAAQESYRKAREAYARSLEGRDLRYTMFQEPFSWIADPPDFNLLDSTIQITESDELQAERIRKRLLKWALIILAKHGLHIDELSLTRRD